MAFDYTTIGLPPSARVSTDEALPQLLTISDCAERLRCSLSYAHRLVARGDLSSVKLGRARRVRAEDLDRFVDGLLASQDGVERPRSSAEAREAQAANRAERLAHEASGGRWKGGRNPS